MIALKSIDTATHCIRVSRLSMKIGNEFNISEKDKRDLFISSILHDIGKIGIPCNILNKPDKLTDKEYEIIKTHCKIGQACLSKIDIFRNVPKIVLFHHERYDGKGYPYGLSGRDIPFLSRIINVADAFDAMTSSRVYRSEIDVTEATKEIIKNSGTQFDSKVVDVLMKVINKNS